MARTAITLAKTAITSARTAITLRRQQIFNFPYLLQTAGTNNISVATFDPTGDSGQSLTGWCWMNGNMAQNGTSLLSKFDYGINQRAFLMMVGPAGNLRVLLSAAGVGITKDYRTSNTICDNRHHFVAFTWNNGTLKVFTDGEESSVTKVTDAAMTAIFNSTARIGLGHNYTTGVAVGQFTGLIGRAGLAPVVATAAQIRDLYYEGKVTLSSTSGLWDTTEGSGTTLTDTSGNGRNMTITNATWNSFTPRKARTVIS
jgi:hypothetical protein